MYRPNLDAFYRFMFERHMIWHKRFRLKQPPPWTKDPILRDLKFTNVYRELDRGTQFYLECMNAGTGLALSGSMSKELLWLTTQYRLLNRVETFDKTHFVSHEEWHDDKREWKKELKELHKTECVFTNAHLTLPVHEKGQSKIDKYFEVLDELWLIIPRLLNQIKSCHSLEQLFIILKQIPCVGSFISYEICCDLILVKAVPFSEDDWANCGPGAKGGIKLIFPLAGERGEYLEKMRQLANEQEKHFKRLGLDFPYLYPGKPLTLRSVEHSCCEFRKYVNVQNGVGKHRMKFKPITGENPQGQIRFPRELE